jgi:enoyl-[acyl-carrier protein] reductase II
MPWLMGQGVGLVNDIRLAGEVVEWMMNEAHMILRRLGRSLP